MANEQDNKEQKCSLTREEIILEITKAVLSGRRSGLNIDYIKDGFKYGNMLADLLFGIKKPEDLKN